MRYSAAEDLTIVEYTLEHRAVLKFVRLVSNKWVIG